MRFGWVFYCFFDVITIPKSLHEIPLTVYSGKQIVISRIITDIFFLLFSIASITFVEILLTKKLEASTERYCHHSNRPLSQS